MFDDDTTDVGVDAVLSADVGDAPMRRREYSARRTRLDEHRQTQRNRMRWTEMSTGSGLGGWSGRTGSAPLAAR